MLTWLWALQETTKYHWAYNQIKNTGNTEKTQKKMPISKIPSFQSWCLWRKSSLIYSQFPLKLILLHTPAMHYWQIGLIWHNVWPRKIISGHSPDPKDHSAYSSRDLNGCQRQLDARKWKWLCGPTKMLTSAVVLMLPFTLAKVTLMTFKSQRHICSRVSANPALSRYSLSAGMGWWMSEKGV